MKKHLDDKTRWLKACQKRCEELAAILWIQLKINSSCRRGQKELIMTHGSFDSSEQLSAFGFKRIFITTCPHLDEAQHQLLEP